jgi:hypothetical protein
VEAVTDRDSLVPRELLAVAALLLAIGVAAFGWYVLHGGFYGDDWGNAAEYRFSSPPRYWDAVKEMRSLLGGRPILALLLPLPHAVLCVHPRLHLALGVVLAVATSVSFYVVLRLLRLRRVDAFAMSVLGLLFPWADAIELWPTASINTVAVIFFFAGFAVALVGLRRPGWRGTATHAAAACLYLASVLTYEVAGAVAVLAGAFYLRRASRPTALRRWAADVVVVIAGLAYSLHATIPVRHVGTLHDRLTDVGVTTREAGRLLAWSLVPAGGSAGIPHRIVLVLAVALLIALLVRAMRGNRDRPVLWAWVGAQFGVAITCAYFMLLGSGLHPLDLATGTRGNALARFAYAGLVYAVVAAAAALALPTRRRAARVLTLAVVGAIAIGYSARLASDESAWAKAARLQHPVTAAIDRGFPALERGTTLLTFGAPAEVAPGAPIFVATWDLSGALSVRRNDDSLHAYPVYESVELHCGASRVVVRLPGSRGTAAPPYGPLFFLDVPTGRKARITGRAGCLAALRRFRLGPYYAS